MIIRRSLAFVQLSIVLFVALIGLPASSAAVSIQFVNHIQASLPEQDVFVERSDLPSDRVVRVEGSDINRDSSVLLRQVFATATPTPHDPFKLGPNPLGPFQKGLPLGFTLQQWLAAAGTGTYTVSGDTAAMSLSFQRLVSSGLYTVWCSRLTFPPNAGVVDTPCGAQDGSQNVFRADGLGNGIFNLQLKPLPDSTKETATIIAIAYHSDGRTCGFNPCNFGLNSHLQLFFLVPLPQTASAEALGLGVAVAAMGIGIGGAAVAVAIALTASGRSWAFYSGGYYLCSRHLVPLWPGPRGLWCPVEGRYVRLR